MKLAEVSARKFDYRKWKIPIVVASILIVGMLLTLLVFVPLVFGEQFVSVSFELNYILPWGNYRESMEIVYVNGSIIPISWIGLIVKVTNSYIVPVEVTYNGFDHVMLVYNSTVNDPADIVANKEFLVWGAFFGFYLPFNLKAAELDNKTQPNLGNHSGYDYYVACKDLSNYTKIIGVGTSRYPMFYEPMMPTWAGQDLHGHPVAPGTYHIYCVAYGKASRPINLTVTSVFWGQ